MNGPILQLILPRKEAGASGLLEAPELAPCCLHLKRGTWRAGARAPEGPDLCVSSFHVGSSTLPGWPQPNPVGLSEGEAEDALRGFPIDWWL